MHVCIYKYTYRQVHLLIGEVQGYLVHKKQRPPRTPQDLTVRLCLGPFGVLGGGGLFLISGVPSYPCAGPLSHWEDMLLDGPASGAKGSKGGSIQDPILTGPDQYRGHSRINTEVSCES